MTTIEIKVYQFDELTEPAKEKAREWWRQAQDEYTWASEAMASIKALAEHFNGKIKNWQIDWFNNSYSSMDFDMPELEPGEIEAKLLELGTFNAETLKGHGDCKLTGYCADEDAIDGFRIAWHKEGERDLDKLIQAAFDSWLKAAQADCEWQMKDEQVDACLISNEYTFTESGKRFSAAS